MASDVDFNKETDGAENVEQTGEESGPQTRPQKHSQLPRQCQTPQTGLLSKLQVVSLPYSKVLVK